MDGEEKTASEGNPSGIQAKSQPRKRKLRLIHESYEKNGPTCFYCSRELLAFESVLRLNFSHGRLPSNYPTLDHVLARSKGGQFKSDNIVVACPPCNRRKMDSTIAKFLDEQKEKLF